MSHSFETKTFSVNTSLSSSTSAPPSTTSKSDSPYSFLVEWFDTAASLARKFTLTFYPSDSTLELFDLRAHRTFLKRCSYPSVTLSSLYLGGQLTVYARTLKIIGYGDESTRTRLEVEQGRTLALIKPSAVGRVGWLLQSLHEAGMRVGRHKMLKLTPQQAQQFYGDTSPSSRSLDLSSGRSIAIEVVGKGAHAYLASLLSSSSGPSPPFHASTSERSASDELTFLFSLPSSASLHSCSLVLIKPHAVQAGQAGPILSLLSTAFSLTALQTFHLTREAAEEFLEVYKGVVGEYGGWVEELSSGQCVAVEVMRRAEEEKGEETIVEALRVLAGPYDPEIARHLRKGSMRAVYGVNKVKNAVHVTDLTEDGPLESEFFFNLLQQAQ